MRDLVKRIRLHWPDMTFELAEEAADEIERLRAADGYDVYAAAREEYRKKIAEQADEIEKLRAALEDIAHGNPLHNEDDLMRIARAALEGK